MSIVGDLSQKVRRFITDAPVDGKVRGRKDGEWVEVEVGGDLQPSMTGSATLNGTTDNTVQLTGIVTTLGLEVGDVIRIQYSGYNKLHTVESITNDNTIIVNYEHAGNRGNGSLKLANQTSTVTITRITKWYNAPIGLGQGIVNLSSKRVGATNYLNQTNRVVYVSLGNASFGGRTLTVDGQLVSGNEGTFHTAQYPVPSGSIYSANANSAFWTELR